MRKEKLTAKPIIATRPTKSSFCLVKPIPPDVPKIPSSTLGFSFTTTCKIKPLLLENIQWKIIENDEKKKKKELRKTFLAGAALVLDLKRATVVVDEERGEVFLGDSKIWEKGCGLSRWISDGCSPLTTGFAVSSIAWAMIMCVCVQNLLVRDMSLWLVVRDG